jgi:hypothetical protein
MGNASTTQPDDLEAVRKIVEALMEFKSEDQQRILRWVREKMGLPVPAPDSLHSPSAPPIPGAPVVVGGAPLGLSHGRAAKDIKSFVDEKNPISDTHLAATVAYYFRYEAPDAQRKESIDASGLRDALRLAGRPGKLKDPGNVLANAVSTGLMDRVGGGLFSINSVGENLVGMILPGDGAMKRRPRGKSGRGAKKRSSKTSTRRK